MPTIFVICLEENYTIDRFDQIKPETGKSMVKFESQVDTASETVVAKDNAAESVGAMSMNQMSGGDRSKTNCGWCNTDSHSSHGFEAEVRKKLCKAWGNRCDKCGNENHVKLISI